MNMFLLDRFATATPTTEGKTEEKDGGGRKVKIVKSVSC